MKLLNMFIHSETMRPLTKGVKLSTDVLSRHARGRKWFKSQVRLQWSYPSCPFMWGNVNRPDLVRSALWIIMIVLIKMMVVAMLFCYMTFFFYYFFLFYYLKISIQIPIPSPSPSPLSLSPQTIPSPLQP